MKKISGYVLAMIFDCIGSIDRLRRAVRERSPKAEGGQGKTEATKGNLRAGTNQMNKLH